MILIAFGANLPSHVGAPRDTVIAARQYLLEHGFVREVAFSSLWFSAPVPASDQPWYCNAVMAVESDYEPLELLSKLHECERAFGRERIEGDRNAARTLDLDVIAYHDIVSNDPHLELPHPRMAERGFVLKPLVEIAKDWMHPQLQLSAEALLARLPQQDQDDLHLFDKAAA